jgi:uncharacterized membrane protein YjgN (DUF898 family)
MSNGQPILVPIPDDFELFPGNEIQMRFEWKLESTYGRAVQWAMIESKLEKQYAEFEVLRYTNTDQDLIVEVRVKEAAEPELQQASVISVGVIMAILGLITAGIFSAWAWKNHEVFLNTKEENAYAQTTTAKLEAGSKFTLALAALAAVIVFGLVKLK